MTTSIVVSGKSLLIVGVAINVVAVSIINSRFERRVKSARERAKAYYDAEEFVRNQYNRLVVKHIKLVNELCGDSDDRDAYREDLRLQGDFANIVLENL